MAGKVLEVRRLGLAGLAQLIPAAGITAFWSAVRHHPVIAVIALTVYEVAAFVVGFAGQVMIEVRGRRVQSAANTVDQWLQRRGSSITRVYLRQVRANVRNMETVGIATQGEYVLHMRQVYVDVSLVPKALHATAREPYLGAVPAREDATVLGQRRSLASVLQDAERRAGGRALAVIGGPGSGKTTLTRNTALSLCERQWGLRRRQLPVLLYLRDHATALLADDPPTLGTVAVSAAWLGGKVPAGWLERRLDRGRCVVLLDGLDEVAAPEERGRVVEWIKRQIQQHPRTVFVVTSRPHGYQSNPLPQAEVLQVRRFTKEQISRFLHQWSYAIERRARDGAEHEARAAGRTKAADLLAQLRARPALYDLASNPLLLTMTANVHRYRDQLPGSRAALYSEMCDVLLHRRTEARGLSDATGLSGPHKQHVVQHLALAMMEASVRDWSLPEAIAAIRDPLQHVPGDVSAEVFLDEARKSGLLVEREQGVYGFAHLTLQEYLAAAQLGTQNTDTSPLTRNVSNPWWRETILLWAAGNDATEVITACLDSGTVSALALAYECADQARTVAPGTRNRLEALLQFPETGRDQDPARRRQLMGIRATRLLRETIPISDSAGLCAQPIPRSLYDQFVYDEQVDGRHHPHTLGYSVGHGGDVLATGMHAGDAERFVNWLNTVTGDDVYRLPTPEELDDPAAEMTADLTRHAVWARSGARTLLHPPSQAPWPYTLTSERLRALPSADLQRVTLYLRFLASSPSLRMKVQGWIRVIATALKHAPDYPHIAVSDPLKLVLTLDHARNLARDLARDRASFRDRETGHARARDLDRARSLAVDLVRDLDHACGLADRLDPRLARDLERDLDRASNFALDPDPGLARALPDLGPDLARALDLARELVPTLTSSSGLGLLARDLDLGPVLDLARDLCLDSQRDIDDLEHLLDLALDVALAHDFDPAYNFDIDFGPHGGALKVAFTAVRILLDVVASSSEAASGPKLTEIDELLTRAGMDDSSSERQAPEDPAFALAQVHDRLRLARHSAQFQLLSQTLLLNEQTLELLLALRDRKLPAHPHVLACIRTALLAAIAALCATGGHSEEAASLHLIRQSLAIYNHPSPNQILLVTRTYQ